MSSFGATPRPQSDVHADQPVLSDGPPLERAKLAMILIHGRGGSAEDMLGVYQALGMDEVAAIAPQAAGCTWYPNSFMAPLQSNQPFLESALRRIESIIAGLIAQKIAGEKIAVLGFSQGACVAMETVARYPRRYAAVMGLSGGLAGPPGTPRNYPGSLGGTPIFLGGVDPDSHVPFERVKEAETVLKKMGGEVEMRRYPGLPHTINSDEMDACRKLLQRAMGNSGDKDGR
jgi:predicted esterase